MPFPLVQFASLLFVSLLLAPNAFSAAQKVDFNNDVQPILSEYCYSCHGPDSGSRKAELRLDRKEGAYRTKDDVTVVKPGDVAHSELYARISSDDPDEIMPPPKSKKKLSAAQVATLKQWITEGAPWGEHWAFVAPKRPPLPDVNAACTQITAQLKENEVSQEAWKRNPIDAFILQKLAKEKLAPSPESSPEKIIRRMSLDLTGIPPTLEEVDAFQQAANHNIYSATEALADRLLASPRYGERMAWDWLDAGRYADTNGYQGDPTRSMWYWRDWVIKAFNSNLPFDKFTIEQIAGDLLPDPTQDQLIATGFHRNHMINGEGGRIPEESRVDYVQDRVETTGEIWLGLTFTCCRCHDHKYDPLLQRDYYSMSAYFNSIDESGGKDAGEMAKPVMSLATPEQQKKIDDLKTVEAQAKKDHDELEKKVRAEQPQWETAVNAGSAKAAQAEWHTLAPEDIASENGATLTKQEDNSVLASGTNPDTDDLVFTTTTKLKNISSIKLEVLPDDSLEAKGPGRAPNGSWVLTEFKMLGDGKPVELEAVHADFEQPGWPLKNAIDDKNDTGWGTWPQVGKPHEAVFGVKTQFGYRSDMTLSFRLQFRSKYKQHVIGRFRISITDAPPALLRPMPEDIKLALASEPEQRTAAQQKAVTDFYLASEPSLIASRKKADAAKSVREAAEKALPKTMIMRDRPQPRDTFILVRGAYDKPGEKVSHNVPKFLPHLPPDAPQNRLALARWLVAPENPLTARVIVNRLWQTFFGIGLVKTSEDFGMQGEKPSHPELLDWLTREFIESGWDVKHIVKLIVTSQAYLQASGGRGLTVLNGEPAQKASEHSALGTDHWRALYERDPENRLLARGPRHRLPSWMLRDQALALSGLLVDQIGGPPVKSYQPSGIWEEATFGSIKYKQDHGESLYRRSLYIFWRRIVAPTELFDIASRQTCTVKVARTNTPLHALVTLNDVTYTEAARVLAERMLKQNLASDAERLVFGFRICTARLPNAKESAALLTALNRFREQFTAAPDDAKKFISAGESKPDPKLNLTELAAHTALSSLLLNLDETLSSE